MEENESNTPAVRHTVGSRYAGKVDVKWHEFGRLARRPGPRLQYGVPMVVLVGALAAVAVTGSSLSVLVALTSLAALVALTVGDVRRNRILTRRLRMEVRKNSGLEDRLALLERRFAATLAAVADHLLDHRDADDSMVGDQLPPVLAPAATTSLLQRGDALGAYTLVTSVTSEDAVDLEMLRRLRESLRERQYLSKAADVATLVAARSGEQRDERALRRINGEIIVTSGELTRTMKLEARYLSPNSGLVLHLVGRSLPDDQTGYTVRTQCVAVAQQQAGLDPRVVTQMGVSHDGADIAEVLVDGIRHYRIPGPRRGQDPFDVWLGQHIRKVADLVERIRPAALHAASDFVNAQTALVVGRAFGISVVYESRGFWEETWLSRSSWEFGWDLDRLASTYGLPDGYSRRRDLEDASRREADRVVTLDPVMVDRVEAGGVDRHRIHVVPNAVAPEDFPVRERDRTLAEKLGIDPDAVVIGYISTLTDYEGVDTLISAFAEVSQSTTCPVALLLVGDGPERERLSRQARELRLENVIFTGQVRHDDILGYYSVIDIFVVPRHPVPVCHLVTPLKPFEAFSTGRAVVLSNVRALASIAKQSGSAEVFEAGNASSLAGVLKRLVEDPVRRRELAASGAKWVRNERTWQANATAYVRLYRELGAA